MRSILVAILIIVTVGCDLNPETRTRITFVNNTDSHICYYSDVISRVPENCLEVKPGKKSVRISCSSGERVDTAGTTVVLTDGPGGREIYSKGALCTEWTESGGQIVIEQSGDGFVITDSLRD